MYLISYPTIPKRSIVKKTTMNQTMKKDHSEKKPHHRKKTTYHMKKTTYHRKKTTYHKKKTTYHREKTTYHRVLWYVVFLPMICGLLLMICGFHLKRYLGNWCTIDSPKKLVRKTFFAFLLFATKKLVLSFLSWENLWCINLLTVLSDLYLERPQMNDTKYTWTIGLSTSKKLQGKGLLNFIFLIDTYQLRYWQTKRIIGKEI